MEWKPDFKALDRERERRYQQFLSGLVARAKRCVPECVKDMEEHYIDTGEIPTFFCSITQSTRGFSVDKLKRLEKDLAAQSIRARTIDTLECDGEVTYTEPALEIYCPINLPIHQYTKHIFLSDEKGFNCHCQT